MTVGDDHSYHPRSQLTRLMRSATAELGRYNSHSSTLVIELLIQLEAIQRGHHLVPANAEDPRALDESIGQLLGLWQPMMAHEAMVYFDRGVAASHSLLGAYDQEVYPGKGL